MAAAKHKALDRLRRRRMVARKHEQIAGEQAIEPFTVPDHEAALDDEVGDDLLRLIFVACHPVLPTEARTALTLRLLGGLTTPEIARAFLVPEPTIAQRIVRAKRTLAKAKVPFEVPRGAELAARLESVLEVVYLIFNEGYAATAGDDWTRPALCAEALRLGRILAGLAPRRARGARPRGADGAAGLAPARADRPGRRAGAAARPGPPPLGPAADPPRPRRPRACRGPGRCRGLYALQAAIAACHARAVRAEETDWARIAALYAVLARVTGSPVVELNRAVAVGMAAGPAAGLALVDDLWRPRCAGALPPVAQRARRPARQAGPDRRGPRRVPARGVADPQCQRAGIAAPDAPWRRDPPPAAARVAASVRGGGAPCELRSGRGRAGGDAGGDQPADPPARGRARRRAVPAAAARAGADGRGEAALPELRKAFAHLAGAVEGVRAGSLVGPLVVSVIPSFAGCWLVPRLAGFVDAYPDIDVTVQAELRNVDFAREDVDVGIRYGRGHLSGAGQTAAVHRGGVPRLRAGLLGGPRPLRRPRICAIIRSCTTASSPARSRRCIGGPGCATSASADVDRKRGVGFSDAMMLMEATVRGMGVALGPRRPCRRRAGRRPAGPAVPAEPARRLRLLRRGARGARAAPRVRAFLGWLEERGGNDKTGDRGAVGWGQPVAWTTLPW